MATKTRLESSFWKDIFSRFKWVFVVLCFSWRWWKALAMLLTSVCFEMEFCHQRHMFIFISICWLFDNLESSDHFGHFTDRLHLHLFVFSQPSSVMHLVFLFCSYLRLLCSSFCVRENYFWQLFLEFFFSCRILTIIVYTVTIR